ncbi:glycosyltransferase [Candidatus Woesearchaeota archaeon]|nr:glycosyltransferase [Candidatus Woesearchaeota archaeon]
MKLSIIIPAHNEEKTLKKTIRNLNLDSVKNKELIIVCNGCTDDSERIAKRCTRKVYSTPVAGVSRARNLGAKKATGDVLVFHDADTACSRNYLKAIRKAVQRGCDYGCARQIPETGNLWYRLLIKTVNHNSKNHRIFHGNCFMTKKLFEPYNPNLKSFEDTELALRLKNKGNFIYLENCWIRPSERNFKKNGYFLTIMKIIIKGAFILMRK